MRWSKVRKLVEESFAPSVRGRVSVHSTHYGGCSCGRGWITIDGAEIADLGTLKHWERCEWVSDPDPPGWAKKQVRPTTVEERSGRLVGPGEFSRFDLHEAAWTYLHSSVNDSIASNEPLVPSLAVLNSKVGRQRLRRLADSDDLHPLTRALLEFRMQCEGLTAPRPSRP